MDKWSSIYKGNNCFPAFPAMASGMGDYSLEESSNWNQEYGLNHKICFLKPARQPNDSSKNICWDPHCLLSFTSYLCCNPQKPHFRGCPLTIDEELWIHLGLSFHSPQDSVMHHHYIFDSWFCKMPGKWIFWQCSANLFHRGRIYTRGVD